MILEGAKATYYKIDFYERFSVLFSSFYTFLALELKKGKEKFLMDKEKVLGM